MFKLHILDAKNFKYILEAISELVDEIMIFVDSNSFRIEACDPSLVCKIELFLEKNFFSSFEVSKETVVLVDNSTLSKVGRRIKMDDSMILECDNVSLNVTLKSSIERNFSCMLLDAEERVLPKIDVEYPVNIEIDTSVFREGIKDVAVIGSTVTFKATPEKFLMTSEGETGKASISIEKTNETVKNFETSKEFFAGFNLSYIVSFLRSSFVSDTARISFGGNNIPLKIQFLMKNGFLTFYLAPMEI